MASSVEAGVVPSSLAEQYLQEGAFYLGQDNLRQAKRSFDRAVAEDPLQARNVADYYDQQGDGLQGANMLKRKRDFYSTAKDYYKQLLRAPTPPQYDPVLFRADLDCRIGNAYNKMSSLNPGAYNTHDTQRAIAYFDAAVAELGGLHMEQAHQGRLLALAKKLGHSEVRPWYEVGHKFDPKVLTAALQDLATLQTLPAEGVDLLERFATAATLFTYPMDEASQALVQETLIPQLGAYLLQPPLHDMYAEVQKTVLTAFAQLLREHAWSSAAITQYVHSFVANGSLQRAQLEPLSNCYKALIQGNKAVACLAVQDMPLLAAQFTGADRAQGEILKLCQMFIELTQAINDVNIPLAAVQTVKEIGSSASTHEVLLTAIDNLLYAADSYEEIADECVRALGSIAQAHDNPSSKHRTLARESVMLHLRNMRRVPHLANVVREVLFEQMGVTAEDLVAEPLGSAPAPLPAL